MKITTQQASALLCPFNRNEQSCSSNRCMMWRWVPTDTFHYESKVHDVGNGRRELIQMQVPDQSYLGYCGLAGKPLV